MDSFEALGLSPEIVDALAADGIEVPTSLQAEAIPLLRRGNSVLLRGLPGSGITAAWGVPLLDRLEASPGGPAALIVVPTREMAGALARSMAPWAAAVGLRVADLAGPYALPGHAQVVFGTPRELEQGIRDSALKTDGVQALVLVGAAALLDRADDAAVLKDLLEIVAGAEIQRIVVADPITEPVKAFVQLHLKRAVHVPSDAVRAVDLLEAPPVRRGTLHIRTAEAGEQVELPALVGDLLEGGASHLLLFFRSEDRAADLGDLLTLHGYQAGAPGDPEVPIWLAMDGLSARQAVEASEVDTDDVRVLSVDVPLDADELDQRHGGVFAGGTVFALSREMAHIKHIAHEAGYEITPVPTSRKAPTEIEQFHALLDELIDGEDLVPYDMLLEEPVARHGATQVAAALALLVRRKGRLGIGRSPQTLPDAEPAVRGASERVMTSRAPAPLARLFLSIGSKDGIKAGDLLGAITGEAGIRGDQVGRIDLKETYTRVEVEEVIAAEVIRALNGISLRGRSIRADYDRMEDRSGSGGTGGGGGGGRPVRSAPRGPGRGPDRDGPDRGGPGGPSRGPGGPSRGPGGPSRGGPGGPSRGPGGPSRGPGGPSRGGPGGPSRGPGGPSRGPATGGTRTPGRSPSGGGPAGGGRRGPPPSRG